MYKQPESKFYNRRQKAYHIELEKKEKKKYNCKVVVQEKVELKHHPKENCENC